MSTTMSRSSGNTTISIANHLNKDVNFWCSWRIHLDLLLASGRAANNYLVSGDASWVYAKSHSSDPSTMSVSFRSSMHLSREHFSTSTFMEWIKSHFLSYAAATLSILLFNRATVVSFCFFLPSNCTEEAVDLLVGSEQWEVVVHLVYINPH